MIPFNIPPYTGTEIEYVKQAIESHKIGGDGSFTKNCNEWIERRLGARQVLLTTSCSSALDMAALLCELEPGDEVILPSFTFSSTANAFVHAGAKLVFVDIRKDTMNIDENKIEQAITEKTRAICVMHYAGVACEMDTIMRIAGEHGLMVVEDAAQGFMSEYKGRALGTIGDFGCFSFHETKNFSMGEGGAIVINNDRYAERAEIIREKGTNRSKFIRGQVDKYTWMDMGGSYLPSELNVAYLWSQFCHADEIFEDRMGSYEIYDSGLRHLQNEGKIEVPVVPEGCKHNAHIYYVKCRTLEERTCFISYMRDKGVECAFHYIPLHSSPAGLRFGRFQGHDEYTTMESNRLVRLPLYYGMKEDDLKYIIGCVNEFYRD